MTDQPNPANPLDRPHLQVLVRVEAALRCLKRANSAVGSQGFRDADACAWALRDCAAHCFAGLDVLAGPDRPGSGFASGGSLSPEDPR